MIILLSESKQSRGHSTKMRGDKEEDECNTADKIFEILISHFGSGMKRHQAMMRFEKKN